MLFSCGGGERPPHIVLLLLDAVRYDALQGVEIWEGRKPDLVFTNLYAPSPWTLPSVTSLLTGKEFWEHGLHYANFTPPQNFSHLLEDFHHKGYQSHAIITNSTLVDVSEKIFSSTDLSILVPSSLVIDKGFSWLKRQKKPGFLYLHFMETHEKPVDLCEENLRKKNAWELLQELSPSEKDRLYLKTLYYHQLKRTLAEIQTFFRALQTSGLAEDTLVILVSDHGEELGERGLIGHGFDLSESLLHVPGFLYLPKKYKEDLRVPPKSFYSLEDVLPLVEGILGWKALPPPRKTLYFGSPLYGQEILGIREGPWKLVWYLPIPHPSLAYANNLPAPFWGRGLVLRNLRRDPYELSNFLSGEPKMAEKLKKKLIPLLPKLPKPSYPNQEQQKKLHALGYL